MDNVIYMNEWSSNRPKAPDYDQLVLQCYELRQELMERVEALPADFETSTDPEVVKERGELREQIRTALELIQQLESAPH